MKFSTISLGSCPALRIVKLPDIDYYPNIRIFHDMQSFSNALTEDADRAFRRFFKEQSWS